MNKKQLIASLSGSLSLSKADAERTFDTITNTILDALKGDDSVKIAGFGTYKVAKRKARVGRNPRTGEQIQIAASQKVQEGFFRIGMFLLLSLMFFTTFNDLKDLGLFN